MNKTLRLILVATALCLTLGGCASPPQDAAGTTSSPSPAINEPTAVAEASAPTTMDPALLYGTTWRGTDGIDGVWQVTFQPDGIFDFVYDGPFAVTKSSTYTMGRHGVVLRPGFECGDTILAGPFNDEVTSVELYGSSFCAQGLKTATLTRD